MYERHFDPIRFECVNYFPTRTNGAIYPMDTVILHQGLQNNIFLNLVLKLEIWDVPESLFSAMQQAAKSSQSFNVLFQGLHATGYKPSMKI